MSELEKDFELFRGTWPDFESFRGGRGPSGEDAPDLEP